MTSNFCLGWCHNESLLVLCLSAVVPRTAIVPVGMGNITALPWRQVGKSGVQDCNVGNEEECQSKLGGVVYASDHGGC